MSQVNYFNATKDGTEEVARVLRARGEKNNLVLYFHSGLQTEKQFAEKMVPLMLKTLFSSKYLPGTHSIIVGYYTPMFHLETLARAVIKKTQSFMEGITWLSSIFSVLERFILRTDHGGYPTLIEEVTSKFVKNGTMDDISEGHWKTLYEHSLEMWEEEEQGGRFLLEQLNEICEQKEKAGIAFNIDLLSHGAGSIPVCFLLGQLEKYPFIKINKVIMVSPAVRMKLFDEQLNRHQDRFREFRMFTLQEEVEKKDHLIEEVYPASLLYFISGIAESGGKGDMPILGLHRHFREDRSPYNKSKYKNKFQVKQFGDLFSCREFLNQLDRVVLSPADSNQPGFETDMTSLEGSKYPHKAPLLARSIIYLLSGEKQTLVPDEDLNKWSDLSCNN